LSARFLLGLFDSVYVLALAAWIGSVLFVSVALTPLIFKILGGESGGRFVCALFPRFYAWAAIAGAIALPAYVAVPLCYPEYRGPWVGVQALILLACVLVMLYAGNSLTPAINAARDAGPASKEQFERLRRRSVWLNILVLVAGSGLLCAFAVRPAPRTSGILELEPAERGRFDADLDRVIETIETKYGYRRPGHGLHETSVGAGPGVSPEMIREIDSYYAAKRQRDLDRGRGVPGPGSLPSSSPPVETPGATEPVRKSGGPGAA
jgi:uncharacterized membrane protein